MDTDELNMTDVYNEVPDFIYAYVSRDYAGGIIIHDNPTGQDGEWVIVLENQNGVPHLLVWVGDVTNDPTYNIPLTKD